MAWHCGTGGCPTHSSPEHSCSDWYLAPIRASVGRGGVNRADDVRIIQGALNRFPAGSGGPVPRLRTDGDCRSKTLTAILEFQRSKFGRDLGRIDPGMQTYRALARENPLSCRYQVQTVTQQFSPVCWLACAVMVIQHKRGFTPSAADLGWRGNDFRTPNLTVADEAAGGAEQLEWLRRLGFNPVRTPTPSELTISAMLIQHGPFILSHNMGAFWYGPGWTVQTPGLGHAVVITGLDANSHTVYFNNPWGATDISTTVASIVGAIRRWEQQHPATCSIAYL